MNVNEILRGSDEDEELSSEERERIDTLSHQWQAWQQQSFTRQLQQWLIRRGAICIDESIQAAKNGEERRVFQVLAKLELIREIESEINRKEPHTHAGD